MHTSPLRHLGHATVGVAYWRLNLSHSVAPKARSYTRIWLSTIPFSSSFEMSQVHWEANHGVLSHISSVVL